jgi:hypothetical protein
MKMTASIFLTFAVTGYSLTKPVSPLRSSLIYYERLHPKIKKIFSKDQTLQTCGSIVRIPADPQIDDDFSAYYKTLQES